MKTEVSVLFRSIISKSTNLQNGLTQGSLMHIISSKEELPAFLLGCDQKQLSTAARLPDSVLEQLNFSSSNPKRAFSLRGVYPSFICHLLYLTFSKKVGIRFHEKVIY